MKLSLDNIYHGDCLELIEQIPDKSIDVCITDPPYGIDYQSVWGGRRFPKIKNDTKPFTEFIPLLPRIMKPTGAIYIFTRWDVQQCFIDVMRENGLQIKNILIWNKGIHSMGDLKAAYGSMYESILFCPMPSFAFKHGRPTDIISVPRLPASALVHPNEKPVMLLRRLMLDSSDIGDTILDCTCGSGSTILAAIKEKRHYIGFELDEKYYELTRRRIYDEQRQLTLF